MKKAIISWIILLHQACFAATFNPNVNRADEITLEWLTQYSQRTGYGEHIVHLDKVLKKLKVKNMLEFGLGYSTKHFLEICNKVISVELLTEGYSPDWMIRCLNLYREYPNWIPIAYFSAYNGDVHFTRYKYLGSESLSKAGQYQNATHKSYALIDDFFLIEMDHFITNLLKSHRIDLALVDPGVYVRGDLVQLLFDKTPVIVAHHTNPRPSMVDDVYGYSRIVVPDNYQEIHIPKGFGTTIWVKKDEKYKEFIREMLAYAQN